MSGLLGGLFSLTPMGNYGVLYTSGFLNNSLTKKPKIRWIWCALLAVLGLIIGTLPRLIMGVNYLEDKFPLATFLLFGIASLGLIIASLIKEIKKKDKTTLENILFPTLLIVGMAISFVMTFFLNKSSDQPLIGNEYLSCLVFGFVMGFAVLIPGLPIHSISNIFGMSCCAPSRSSLCWTSRNPIWISATSSSFLKRFAAFPAKRDCAASSTRIIPATRCASPTGRSSSHARVRQTSASPRRSSRARSWGACSRSTSISSMRSTTAWTIRLSRPFPCAIRKYFGPKDLKYKFFQEESNETHFIPFSGGTDGAVARGLRRRARCARDK